MTTISQVLLVAPQQLSASDTVYYTAPALTTAKIGRAVFSNTTAGVVTITVNIATGAAAPANQLIDARALAPGETYVSPELAGAVLPAGYSLRMLASAATSITVMVSGVTVV